MSRRAEVEFEAQVESEGSADQGGTDDWKAQCGSEKPGGTTEEGVEGLDETNRHCRP